MCQAEAELVVLKHAGIFPSKNWFMSAAAHRLTTEGMEIFLLKFKGNSGSWILLIVNTNFQWSCSNWSHLKEGFLCQLSFTELPGAAEGPDGLQAVGCPGWEWSLQELCPSQPSQAPPGVSSPPRYLRESTWEKRKENFSLKYIYLFLMPNGERHLMVFRAQWLDENRAQRCWCDNVC